jgi:hypothetical protein
MPCANLISRLRADGAQFWLRARVGNWEAGARGGEVSALKYFLPHRLEERVRRGWRHGEAQVFWLQEFWHKLHLGTVVSGRLARGAWWLILVRGGRMEVWTRPGRNGRIGAPGVE